MPRSLNARGEVAPRKKKKKRPVDIAVQRGGVPRAPSVPKPEAPARKSAQYKPTILNTSLTDMSMAYKEKHGVYPTAEQAYGMVVANEKHPTNDWLPIVSVLDGHPDPVTNQMQKIGLSYFKSFGAFPNADKMRGMIESSRNVPGDTLSTPDVLSLFPTVGPHEANDITPDGMAADKGTIGAPRRRWGWSEKDLESMDNSKAKADAERKLANTTIHGEEMGYDEIARIYKARGWYLGTDFKSTIIARQTGANLVDNPSGFYNSDGSVNMNKVVREANIEGVGQSNILNAQAYVNIRDDIAGKPRSSLTDAQKAMLTQYAALFQNISPKFMDYYNGNERNLVWDEHFENQAMRYIFLSAAPFALNTAETPEAKKKQKEAYAAIEVATYGKVKAEDDIYKYLSAANSIGMKDSSDMVDDQVSQFKFYAFSSVYSSNMTDYQKLGHYAAHFGENDLPAEARNRYTTLKDSYGPLIGLVNDDPVNPLNNIFNVRIGSPDPSAPELLPGFNQYRWEQSEQKRIETEKQTQKDRLTALRTGRTIQQVQADRDTPVNKWISNNIAAPVEGLFTDANLIMDDFILAGQRLVIFGGFLIDIARSGGYTVKNEKGAYKGVGIEWNPTKKDFWTGKKPPQNQQDCLDTIGDAWRVAKERTNETEFMPSEWGGTRNLMFDGPLVNQVFIDEGLDPKDYPEIVTIASMGLYLAEAAIGDWMIGGVAKGGAAISAKVARLTLSPKLMEEFSAAEKVLDAAKAARATEAATNAPKILHAEELLSQARVAREAGNKAIANRLQRAAMRELPKSSPVAREVYEAERTLELTSRPRWYDTLSSALARSEQDPRKLGRVLGLDVDQIDGPRREMAKRILAKIAASKDQDEITKLLHTLSYKPSSRNAFDMGIGFGIKLDPGSAVMMKGWRYRAASTFEGPLDKLKIRVPVGGTVLRGAPRVSRYIESVGRLTKLFGGKDWQKRIDYYLTKAYDLTAPTEHALNLERQKLWDEFITELKDNMKRRLATNSDKELLWSFAEKAGLQLDRVRFFAHVENQDDVARMFSAIKNRKRMSASGGINLFDKGHLDRFYDEFQSDIPFLLPNPKTHEGGQLAMHLNAPWNLEDIVTVSRGHGAMWRNLAAYSPLLPGVSVFPSWMGITNSFRLMAIARMGFAYSAMMVDEIARFPFEMLNGEVSPKLYRYWKNLKLTKEMGLINDISPDALHEMMRVGDGIVPIAPDHPDYLLYLNEYNVTLRKSAFTDEFIDFVRDPANKDLLDDPAAMKAAFKERLRLLINEDSEEGNLIRMNLAQMGRGQKDTYIPPATLAGYQDDYDAGLSFFKSELTRTKKERDAIRKRMKELRNRVPRGQQYTASLRNPGRPTREFKIAWIRNRHPEADLRTARTAPPTGRPRRRLLGGGQGRDLTDDEVLSAYQHEIEDAGKQFTDDWRDEVASRRGLTREWEQYKQLQSNLAAKMTEVKDSTQSLHDLIHQPRPRSRIASATDEWLDKLIEKFDLYHSSPKLFNAMADGKKLSKKDMQYIRASLKEKFGEEFDLPLVIGSRGKGVRGAGYIPGLSEWSEGGINAIPGVGKLTGEMKYSPSNLPLVGKPMKYLLSTGPYSLLEAASTSLTRVVYIGRFTREYDDLIEAGWNAREAAVLASRRASEYADEVMYSPGRTVFESDVSPLLLFAPAYVQAIQYWAKAFVRNPLLMTALRESGGSQALMAWLGPYSSFIPSPFWMTGDMGENFLPGLTAPLLLPLRMANTLTGFRKDKDGKYQYTGATKLDWIGEKIPMLSFMNKGVSPMTAVDDIFYGVLGDDSYGPTLDATSNPYAAILYGAVISMKVDPEKRKRLATNILMAQTSAGIKPSLKQAQAEFEGSPWWARLFRDTLHFQQPEAIFAAVTRAFNPVGGKIGYTPTDLNEMDSGTTFDVGDSVSIKGGKAGSWYAELWNQEEPQTMAEAEYAMISAYGDEKKVQAILTKYPKYKAIYDYRRMNAEQKSDWLVKDENQWAVPYIVGKNEYGTDFSTLSAKDYYSMKRDGIIQRKNADAWRIDTQSMIDDIGWQKTLNKIEAKHEEDLKTASMFIRQAAREYADNPLELEQCLKEAEFYIQGWTDASPGDMEKDNLRENAYKPWMGIIARKHGYKTSPGSDMSAWNPQYVQETYYSNIQTIVPGETDPNDPRGAKRPKYTLTQSGQDYPADVKGVEAHYTSGNIYSKDYTENLGKIIRINDAITKLMPQQFKDLFAVKRNMSYGKIKELIKQRQSKLNYTYRTIATSPGFYLQSPSNDLEAIGYHISNHADFDIRWQLGQKAYHSYQWDVRGMDTWSDPYKARRRRYIEEVNGLYKPDYMAALRGGAAERISGTYLARPNSGKVDSAYVALFVGRASQKDADMEDIVTDIDVPQHNADPAQYIAAHAWRSVCALSVKMREQMRRVYNEDMNAPGISVDSKAAEPYVAKVVSAVEAWSRYSKKFKKQWLEVGGNELISSFLDYSK